MSKHEAVDRLMELATEKRADPLPKSVAPGGFALESVSRPVKAPIVLDAKEKADRAAPPSPSAGERGRQILNAIRPLLPAVAGAMRLVDHGAVQAVARLLPLLGTSLPGSSARNPQASLDQDREQEQQAIAAAEQQASQKALRRDVDGMRLQLAASDDLLGRTRTTLDRVVAGQAAKESEIRALGDRVRLLTAGLIILLMLIVAQMILLVILLHR